MKLNYDLLRFLLLNIEEYSAPSDALWEPNLENALKDPDVYEHMGFLKECKLIKGTLLPLGNDKQFAYRGITLTAKGFDFVSCSRSDDSWRKAKERMAGQHCTFDAFFEWLKSQADADFLGTSNSKSPKCSKCGGIHFDARHMNLEGAGFGVLSACCAKCGAVAGIVDTKLHDKLNESKSS